MVNKHKEREIVQAKTSLETYKTLYHASPGIRLLEIER
jgi:hypothetical protein